MAVSSALILLLSNARDVTTDFFADHLRTNGCAFVRINTESLESAGLTFRAGGPRRRANTAVFDAEAIEDTDIKAIYYRRPQPPRVQNERASLGEREWIASELRRAWGGWLAATDARWVNHPLAISAASYKPEQLARAERMGLHVPETIITTFPEEARAFAAENNMAVVAKPIGHGEVRNADGSQGGVIYTTDIEDSGLALLDSVATCPTLLQRRLEKDVDLRVTVVGESVFAVALHSQDRATSRIDCRRDNNAPDAIFNHQAARRTRTTASVICAIVQPGIRRY